MTQALLAQPVFNDELGLLMFRPAARDLQVFRSLLDKKTVLLQPAPDELAGNHPGLVNRPGRPEAAMSLQLALEFFRHGAVAQALGCPARFQQWQGRLDKCATQGSDCAGGITWSGGLYPVPLCWHHDNAHRNTPVAEVTQATDRRVLAFGLARVAEYAQRARASEVSAIEVAMWAVAHDVHGLLPEALARIALGRHNKPLELDTGRGWKDTDARYDTRDHIADISKMVKPIKFTVDPEPPASFMARPKLTRWQSEAYLKFVRSQPCVVTGSTDAVEAHHMIGNGHSGMAMKTHDLMAFPLCHDEHMKLHDGGWQRWEQAHGSQLAHVMATLNKAAGLGVFG